jgi:hypothetical protein
MYETKSWRSKAFNASVALLATSLVLYFVAIVWVPLVRPVNEEITLGSRFFVIGAALNLLALCLALFGYGWRRLVPAIAALISIFFWYGFTLY